MLIEMICMFYEIVLFLFFWRKWFSLLIYDGFLEFFLKFEVFN